MEGEEKTEDKKEDSASKKVIEKRKDFFKKTLSSWISNPYDRIFLIIFIIAIIIRFWIFIETLHQPVWYDAGSYLATSKKWAWGLDTNDIWYYRRGFLWTLIGAISFKLGFGEPGIRFATILCSIGIVLVSYLLIKEMFNRKLALYTATGLTLSWPLLFFSGRPLTYIPGPFFVLLAALFFWKGYAKKQGNKYIYLFGVFYALAIFTRMQNLMFAPAFLIFVISREKLAFIKNKRLWMAFGIFLLVLSPLIITYWNHYGNPLADISGYYLGIGGVSTGRVIERDYSELFSYFKDLPYMMTGKTPSNFISGLSQPLMIFLIVGFVLFFVDLILGVDRIFKNKELQAKLFILVWVIFLYLALGYSSGMVFQGYSIPALTFLFLMVGYTFYKAEDLLVKNSKISKKLAFTIVLVVLVAFLIPNLIWGHQLIEGKKNSYQQVKDSGIWIKEHSNPGDIVISQSVPQTLYYSERPTYTFDMPFEMRYPLEGIDTKGMLEEEIQLKYKDGEFKDRGEELFDKYVQEYKPRFMIVSVFENHYEWAYSYPAKHNDTWMPVNAWFADETQTQPLLIIYESNFNNLQIDLPDEFLNEGSENLGEEVENTNNTNP